MGFIQHLYNKLTRMSVRMDFTECAVLVTCVLIVGFICMRGFGSRKNW